LKSNANFKGVCLWSEQFLTLISLFKKKVPKTVLSKYKQLMLMNITDRPINGTLFKSIMTQIICVQSFPTQKCYIRHSVRMAWPMIRIKREYVRQNRYFPLFFLSFLFTTWRFFGHLVWTLPQSTVKVRISERLQSVSSKAYHNAWICNINYNCTDMLTIQHFKLPIICLVYQLSWLDSVWNYHCTFVL